MSRLTTLGLREHSAPRCDRCQELLQTSLPYCEQCGLPFQNVDVAALVNPGQSALRIVAARRGTDSVEHGTRTDAQQLNLGSLRLTIPAVIVIATSVGAICTMLAMRFLPQLVRMYGCPS